jgi:hypothetical protein
MFGGAESRVMKVVIEKSSLNVLLITVERTLVK